MLPQITAEFTATADPELRFNPNGDPWVKVRGVANDRIKNDSGEWGDGNPIYLDVIIDKKPALHFVESVSKGDSFIVSGRLQQREWMKDGQPRTTIQIKADIIGVSTRREPARTRRTQGGLSKPDAVTTATAALGATVIQQEEDAPF